jgi:murein DD-endopeptidase MepM/ murein hydrolase activator NlpD
MNRIAVTCALACTAVASSRTGVASPAVATPGTGLLVHRGPDVGALPALAVARLFAGFSTDHAPELPAPLTALVDDLVHGELVARDVFRTALDGLYQLAADRVEHLPPTPDLSILTTSPLAEMSTAESSGFGWRDDPYHHDVRYHSGTDFRAKYGTPVLAAGDGVVVFAAWQGGYGNVVYVDHGGGILTRYAHLRRIVAKKDASVVAGQEVGEVGSTGRATGPHLHFEVRIDGHAVSPILAMAVAEQQRTDPEAGRIAALGLAPDLQDHAIADVDRPRHAPPAVAAKPSRPDRPDVVRPVKPLW